MGPEDSTQISDRLHAVARDAGADVVLLTSPDAVCWATGYAVPVETGPSPFAAGPALVVSAGDGMRLVVLNTDADAARRSRADEVIDYVGYSLSGHESLLAHFTTAVRRAIAGGRGRVGVEAASLPATVSAILAEAGMHAVDLTVPLARARAVKTAGELELLEHSAAAAAAAQRAVVANARAGMTELELFAAVRCAAETVAGARVPFAGDLLSGRQRTAGVAGWPSDRVLSDGDPVIADLAPRVQGYWADSCNTVVVGPPDVGLVRLHKIAHQALQEGMAVAVPGARACDVDAAVRAVVARAGYRYPHHTGHGIGTSVHEFPRLVPDETARLESGMVILIEPGVYDADVGGVRLEWMFAVTDHGLRRLTEFEHHLVVPVPAPTDAGT